MTSLPSCCFLHRCVCRILLSLMPAICLFLSPAARADIAKTIDQGELAGHVTLQAGADAVSITDEQGKSQSVSLQDIDQISFGEDLVILNGGDRLLIDNDHPTQRQSRTGAINLRAGLHRLVVACWTPGGDPSLSLTVSGPGLNDNTPLSGTLLRCLRNSDTVFKPSPGIDADGYRLPEFTPDQANDNELFTRRARYRLHVGDPSMQVKSSAAMSRMRVERSGTTSSISSMLAAGQNAPFAIVFEGFFLVAKDATYTFSLASTGGSQLYLGQARTLGSAKKEAGDTPQAWRVELRHGGIARGGTLRLKEQALELDMPLGDEQAAQATLNVSQVLSAWDQSLAPDAFNRTNEPTNEDTVYIRDKQDPAQIRSVSGKIVSIDEQTLSFLLRDQERSLNRTRVAGIVFAQDPAAAQKIGFHQTLRFSSGQVLPGKIVSIDERVVFELIGGGKIDAPRDGLIELRSENGRRVDLANLKPSAVETVPYFGLEIPHRINTSFSGDPIRLFNDRVYQRGIAVHSKSRLHYKLDRPCERLSAAFGLLKPGGKLGNVTARVLGDGKVLWEKTDITAQTDPIDLSIELKGVKRLVLEVDFGEGQDVGDRAAWCNPSLLFAPEE